jgi:hypothetical protein
MNEQDEALEKRRKNATRIDEERCRRLKTFTNRYGSEGRLNSLRGPRSTRAIYLVTQIEVPKG